MLSKFLAKKITNYNNPRSIASKFRAKRFSAVKKMIDDVFKEKGQVKIIDVGGTHLYWQIVPKSYLEEKKVTIVIVNLEGTSTQENDSIFTFIPGDACNLNEFQDHSFDIAHSNSVIEHVGDWSRMLQMAEEISRVAKRHFVQTPNFWFPLEPHCMTFFFHYFPKPIRIWMVCHFSLGHWEKGKSIKDAVFIVESARLLTRKMMQALFPDHQIMIERFLGLPKSIMAIKNTTKPSSSTFK